MLSKTDQSSAMDNFTVLGRIGAGAHGIVMKARHKKSCKLVALKKLLIKRPNEGIPSATVREIKILQTVESPYIVKLYYVFPQGLGLVLVFEFLGLNLSQIINNSKIDLNESSIKTYMVMLLKGLIYLHSHSLMHRDLKPDNLLISCDGRLKIADLGLSRIFSAEGERPYSHEVATRWYRAPELLYGSRSYTQSMDLWSTGCIFGEMLNRSPIFRGENDIDQLGIVIKVLGTFNEETWPGAKELPDYSKITFPSMQPIPLEEIVPDASKEAQSLLKAFLVYDGKIRVEADTALRHRFFNSHPIATPLKYMPKSEELFGKTSPDTSQSFENNIQEEFDKLKDLPSSLVIPK
ncbi:cyclin-dependent kinase 20 [Lepeophtheirus salmonis]|uniref:Cyclin-dependent kinase 20 n=1 Tax=Lepeophtheirus salmonis TaxID=72036 RepID=A0A0K2TNW6_LEPSM|nr:cyclin-dependent kinase 20-like [Lepeophtheirus salmonis]